MSQFETARRNLAAAAARSQEPVAPKSDHPTSSRPTTSFADRKIPEPVPLLPQAEEKDLPERRRPPILQDQSSFEDLSAQKTTNTAFYTPSETPQNASGASTPKDASKEASQVVPALPQQTEYFDAKLSAEDRKVEPRPAEIEVPAAPQQPMPSEKNETAPISPVSEKPDHKDTEQQKKADEEYRPGLGPMLKKKSGKDIANQFRKAALAATAFQPRQGGAGARLKAMQDKTSNEPDGIYRCGARSTNARHEQRQCRLYAEHCKSRFREGTSAHAARE